MKTGSNPKPCRSLLLFFYAFFYTELDKSWVEVWSYRTALAFQIHDKKVLVTNSDNNKGLLASLARLLKTLRKEIAIWDLLASFAYLLTSDDKQC